MYKLPLTLLLFTLLSTCALAQKSNRPWTDADARAYAHRNDNPLNWDTLMLREDLEGHLEPPYWPTQPAISEIPSPVADYDWGYCALRPLETTLGGQAVKGINIAYARDAYREEDFTDPDSFYETYCTLIFLTDWPQSSNSANHIVSRNYPHYLATGKKRTSTGDIDWLQMNLADGQNFVVISQRYFDLHFGRTILVAQQKDGSLRFLQVEASPGEVDQKGQLAGLEGYFQSLANDDKVASFFNNQNVIKASGY
ncbi:MAG: hypothetical protein AAF840_09595 [Bacteroidota bacterium]